MGYEVEREASSTVAAGGAFVEHRNQAERIGVVSRQVVFTPRPGIAAGL